MAPQRFVTPSLVVPQQQTAAPLANQPIATAPNGQPSLPVGTPLVAMAHPQPGLQNMTSSKNVAVNGGTVAGDTHQPGHQGAQALPQQSTTQAMLGYQLLPPPGAPLMAPPGAPLMAPPGSLQSTTQAMLGYQLLPPPGAPLLPRPGASLLPPLMMQLLPFKASSNQLPYSFSGDGGGGIVNNYEGAPLVAAAAPVTSSAAYSAPAVNNSGFVVTSGSAGNRNPQQVSVASNTRRYPTSGGSGGGRSLPPRLQGVPNNHHQSSGYANGRAPPQQPRHQ